MNELSVELDSGSPEQTAGHPLRGIVRLSRSWRFPGVRLTAALRWFTMGKGETEAGTFQRPIAVVGLPVPEVIPFAIPLPAEPWTYDGRLIQIEWVLEVEARLHERHTSTTIPLVLRSPFVRAGSSVEP